MAPFKKKDPDSDGPKDIGAENIPKDLLEATAELSDEDFDFGPDLDPDSPPATDTQTREESDPGDSKDPFPDTGSAPASDDLLKATQNLDDKEFELDQPEPHPQPHEQTEVRRDFDEAPGDASLFPGGDVNKEQVPPGLASSFSRTGKKRYGKAVQTAVIAVLFLIGVGAAAGYYYRLVSSVPEAAPSRSAPPGGPPLIEETASAAPTQKPGGETAQDPIPRDLPIAPVEKEPQKPTSKRQSEVPDRISEETSAVSKQPAAELQTEKDNRPEPSVPDAVSTEPSESAPPLNEPDRLFQANTKPPLDYRLYRGYTYEEQGNYGQALKHYRKAAELAPDNYRLHNRIGYVLIRLQLYNEALPPLQEALALKEDYLPALVNTGIVYGTRKDYEQALVYLSRALDINATHPSAVYNMMRICEKKGDFAQARRYREVLEALGEDLP